MARTLTNLRMVVAYPDDVAAERAIVDDVVEEFRATWSHTLGIQIEVVDWKTHSWPNFGSDSQAVINEELGDDYDIFLGIMWMKFGEPTPRAGSGTAEEFHRALKRFKDNPKQLRIMFYFKETSPASLKDVDTKQLDLKREFKELVAKEGGLYFEFTDIKQFASALRMHLSHQVQEYGKTWGCETGRPEIKSKPEAEKPANSLGTPVSIEPNEEEGFLDLVESSTESFNRVAELLADITASMEKSRLGIEEKTAELNELNKANAEIKQQKRVLGTIAEIMDEHSAELEMRVPLMSSAYSSAVDAMTRALSIWSEDFSGGGEEQARFAYSQLQRMLDGLNIYLPSIVSLRTNVSSMPRVTSDFNQSKRRMISALDLLVNEIEQEVELARQLLDHFRRIPGHDGNGPNQLAKPKSSS